MPAERDLEPRGVGVALAREIGGDLESLGVRGSTASTSASVTASIRCTSAPRSSPTIIGPIRRNIAGGS